MVQHLPLKTSTGASAGSSSCVGEVSPSGPRYPTGIDLNLHLLPPVLIESAGASVMFSLFRVWVSPRKFDCEKRQLLKLGNFCDVLLDVVDLCSDAAECC